MNNTCKTLWGQVCNFFHRLSRDSCRCAVLVGAICIALIALFVIFLFWGLPSAADIRAYQPASLGVEQVFHGSQPPAQMLRIWKPLHLISADLQRAVLISEDDSFYQHRGFNWPMVREALRINWQRKRYARGASTLTMQLARNAFLYKDKTLWRKMREVIVTRRIEKTLDKKRILELYLNVVDWGDQLNGAEAAAQYYLGHSAKNLSLAEATLLASMLPNPHVFNPYKRLTSCLKMQKRVLRLMVQARQISPEQAQQARLTGVLLRGQSAAPNPPAEIQVEQFIPVDSTAVQPGDPRGLFEESPDDSSSAADSTLQPLL